MEERWPRLVGGNLALDFVNTDLFSQGDRSVDVLRSIDEFLAWCADAGVTSTTGVPAKRPRAQEAAFLQEALEVRGAIRGVGQNLEAGNGRIAPRFRRGQFARIRHDELRQLDDRARGSFRGAGADRGPQDGGEAAST